MASKPRFMFNRSVSFKDTSDGWKAVIFVLSLYLFSQGQGTIHIICAKSNTDKVTASIPLTCSSDQMIHVISELYGRRTSEENCTIVRADLNTRVSDSSTNGLIVICNGYKQCAEQAACGTYCNGSGNAYEITYECVEDSKSVCNVFNQNVRLPSLYLHSPMFPASQEEEASCECSLSGQSLDVMMIQQRGSQGVLQINTTGAEINTWESNFAQFNTKIASDAGHVVVIYSNHTDRTFWLRISGNITHISCSNSLTPRNRETPKTTETAKVTETTKTYIETIETTEATETIETIKATEGIGTIEATETIGTIEAIKATEAKETPEVPNTMTEAIEMTTKTETETSTESIISHTPSEGRSTEEINTTGFAVCGVIIFLLLVIIGLLLVYFKVIKPRTRKQNETEDRVSSNETDNDNISGSNETRNTYSDLVKYVNQDNDYGKLHTYANP